MIKPSHVLVKFDLVIATDWPVIPKSKRGGSAVANDVTACTRQQSLSATCGFAGNFHAARLPAQSYDGTWRAEWADGQGRARLWLSDAGDLCGYAESQARGASGKEASPGMPVMTMANTGRTGVQHNARKIVQNDHGTDKATLAQTVAVP